MGDIFDWDEGNLEHFAHRDISNDEAEDVLLSPDRLVLTRGTVHGEHRYAVIGSTEEGRILVVVYTRRDEMLRIITARRPTPRELGVFRRRRR